MNHMRIKLEKERQLEELLDTGMCSIIDNYCPEPNGCNNCQLKTIWKDYVERSKELEEKIHRKALEISIFAPDVTVSDFKNGTYYRTNTSDLTILYTKCPEEGQLVYEVKRKEIIHRYFIVNVAKESMYDNYITYPEARDAWFYINNEMYHVWMRDIEDAVETD